MEQFDFKELSLKKIIELLLMPIIVGVFSLFIEYKTGIFQEVVEKNDIEVLKNNVETINLNAKPIIDTTEIHVLKKDKEILYNSYKNLLDISTDISGNNARLVEYAYNDLINSNLYSKNKINKSSDLIINNLHFMLGEFSESRKMNFSEPIQKFEYENKFGLLFNNSKLLARILKKFRDKDIISFFYNRNKLMLFSFLGKSDYNETGLKNIVRGLLYSYDELKGKEKQLETLLEISKTQSPNYNFYKPFISKKVQNLLIRNDGDNYYQNEDEKWGVRDIFNNEDVVWCYSFWVRRHGEGNSDIVHSILVEIDKKLTSN